MNESKKRMYFSWMGKSKDGGEFHRNKFQKPLSWLRNVPSPGDIRVFSAKKTWVTINQIIHVILVHVIRQNIHLKIINKMEVTLKNLGNSSIYLKIII